MLWNDTQWTVGFEEFSKTYSLFCVEVNTPKCCRQLWVKDLPKVSMWQLEWDSNLRPSGRKAPNLPPSPTMSWTKPVLSNLQHVALDVAICMKMKSLFDLVLVSVCPCLYLPVLVISLTVCVLIFVCMPIFYCVCVPICACLGNELGFRKNQISGPAIKELSLRGTSKPVMIL